MKQKGNVKVKNSGEQRRRSRVYLEDKSEGTQGLISEPRPSSRERRRRGHQVVPSEDRTLSSSGIQASNSSRSQSPQLREHAYAKQRSRTEPIVSRQQSSNHARSESRESQSRPRTRTLEERIREKSPGSLIARGRNRVGSLQSPPISDTNADSSSIGFPSIVSTAKEEGQRSRRHKLQKPHSRPLSPIRNPIAAKPGTPLPTSSTDAKKILQLMKTTCGRMHGILSFRTSATGSWASGYCAINVASGSLIYQTKGEVQLSKTLVNDLRGCQVRTLYDSESKSTFLAVSSRRTSIGVHLRPHVPETFDQWLAALLCWQPIRPKGAQNKMSKPQDTHINEKKIGDRKGSSNGSQSKDAAIIKVGKMLIWDKEGNAERASSPQPSNRRISTYRPLKSMSSNWRKVSCTLQENGHFKIYTEPESTLEAVIPLSRLSRCSIQRLDPSILDDEYSIAIYPQYTSSNQASPSPSMFFSLDSRVLFEVWFVLLRAFTVPELYGPEPIPSEGRPTALDSTEENADSPATDMFRVERVLTLRIIEAKLKHPAQDAIAGSSTHLAERPSVRMPSLGGNYYAEVQLDGEARARTAMKIDTSNPFFREDFVFSDLPPVFSSSAIELKTRNPGQKAWSLARAPSDLERGDIHPDSIDGDIRISPLDLVFGKVDIRLDGLDRATDTERWWSLVNEQDVAVGEMLMRIRIDELVVLMGRDYAQISEILHSFANGLTNQITQIAHGELKRLSEVLLNIFQVSGHASAWLMSLVEEEIDTVHKETPSSKFRYQRRIASQDSFETNVEREMFVRDLGKNATIEANLLFRGNTLLTKALDSHMRRLGKEYLEETLSEKMRDIEESDPECEVDPHRVESADDLQRNWRNLIALTENVWRAIAASASRCPPELRIIMRRIRDCAEDRYGGFLRTVAYSSVSGFLFLRFFCPAVLNPKLFGLLKGNLSVPASSSALTSIQDHPRPRAQRTLTLITKTLQTLANLNTFGSKEPWMEPMNVFLTNHRPEFKAFIDEICDISSNSNSSIPPSYATPITILNRLPASSKEGFPSLPYLIDQARECAALVDVWLDARLEIDAGLEWSEELQTFDDLCEASREKARECLSRAEQAERPSGNLEPRWEELVESMERKARLKEINGSQSSSNTPVGEGSDPRTVNSSASSITDSYFRRAHRPSRASPAASRLRMTQSPTSPESPLSVDDNTADETGSETTDTAPGSSSAWDSATSPPTTALKSNIRPLGGATPSESEEEFSDLDIENNSDILGSSIYSIKTPKSKRDSTATNKTITPASANKTLTNINSRWRHHLEKGSQSQYSLRRPSERGESSSGKKKSSGGSKSHGNEDTGRGGRSIYRLTSDSQQAVVDKSGNPKSPKEGRPGWQSTLFRKKTREKEEE